MKTDDIDAASVADLLMRGEFYIAQRPSSTYLRLRNLIYWRKQKKNLVVMLRNQLSHRFEKVYPGINSTFNGRTKLFQVNYDSLIHQGLLSLNMTPQEVSRLDKRTFCDLFKYKRMNDATRYGKRLNDSSI